VNFRLVGEEIAYILNDSGASALFHGPEFRPVVEGIRDRCPALRLTVCPGGGPRSPGYEEFLAGGAPAEVDASVVESDQCQLMYTSGTTGRPKGAVISHGNVLWNLVNTILGREDRPGQVSIIVGPLYPAALNHFPTRWHWGKSVLIAVSIPRSCAIEREGKYHQAPALPPIDATPRPEHDYSHYQVHCRCGQTFPRDEGSWSFPNIHRVYDVYGCTELPPSPSSPPSVTHQHGSVGKTLPAGQRSGRTRSVLEPGRVEIICKGQTDAGLLNGLRPLPTAIVHTEIWLSRRRGILLHRSEEDMIVSGGERLSAKSRCLAHPDVDPPWWAGPTSSGVSRSAVVCSGGKTSAPRRSSTHQAHLAS
jgi:hypothetical protein